MSEAKQPARWIILGHINKAPTNPVAVIDYLPGLGCHVAKRGLIPLTISKEIGIVDNPFDERSALNFDQNSPTHIRPVKISVRPTLRHSHHSI